MPYNREMYICPICGRSHIKDYMTFHHLLPSLSHIEKGEQTIYICKTCHQVIHYCHTNDRLRFLYNTLEKLLNSTKIQSMIDLYKYKSDNCVFRLKKLKQKIA